MTRVSWRYRLLSAEPAGLQVQLCTLNRCILLGSRSGSTIGLQGEPAQFTVSLYLLRAVSWWAKSAVTGDWQSGDCQL
ncbi:flagellar protein FlhE [Serratia symbiotica]|nr:flagellar protein FlhE [Serratia symbiotica]USS96781.1 flagellar protein FlhE [Serratia symbiotica]